MGDLVGYKKDNFFTFCNLLNAIKAEFSNIVSNSWHSIDWFKSQFETNSASMDEVNSAIAVLVPSGNIIDLYYFGENFQSAAKLIQSYGCEKTQKYRIQHMMSGGCDQNLVIKQYENLGFFYHNSLIQVSKSGANLLKEYVPRAGGMLSDSVNNINKIKFAKTEREITNCRDFLTDGFSELENVVPSVADIREIMTNGGLIFGLNCDNKIIGMRLFKVSGKVLFDFYEKVAKEYRITPLFSMMRDYEISSLLSKGINISKWVGWRDSRKKRLLTVSKRDGFQLDNREILVFSNCEPAG